ncbi:MAG TPA: ATP-binding cassette domain-containing protein [Gemmatimonadaceae bacterium]|nr:ATP-binding cassette domain-containing protein [Gemmatimonadaceae bacterium]
MRLALRARALWKSYAAGVAGCSARVWVLRGTSLDVEHGECVAILGARGAGTTTLLHCLAGLRRADAGTIELGLTPQLVDAPTVGGEKGWTPDRLVLYDDALDLRRIRPTPHFVREQSRDASTTIIATHELARVRGVADRVLLLHHGRLSPLDHAAGARRVAECLDPQQQSRSHDESPVSH